MQIDILECERLISELINRYGLQNYYSAIYGSAAHHDTNSLSGGDVDLVIISEDFEHRQRDFKIREAIGDYHIYLISNKVFIDDVKTLAYGGYYCHKFALSFAPLFQNGDFMDAPKKYWSYELTRLRHRFKKNINFEDIVRSVHQNILEARPTFLRSIQKYLISSKRKYSLNQFVQNLIKDESIFTRLTIEEIKKYELGVERAFFRFWREWRLHHTDRNKNLNKSVLERMIMSLDSESPHNVFDYLENGFNKDKKGKFIYEKKLS